MSAVPYWRLSAYSLFQFAILGLFIAYWGLYLSSLGFSKLHIGLLISCFTAARLFAPMIFGYCSDISNQPVPIIKTSTAFIFVVFIFLSYSHSFWSLATLMFMFGFLLSGAIPQFDSVTFDFLDTYQCTERYAAIRLWGSVGFVLSVGGGGVFFEYYHIDYLLWLLLSVSAICAMTVMSLPNLQPTLIPQAIPFKTLVLDKKIMVFSLVCFLHQASYGAFYTYFSIYLDEWGYDKTTIGLLWIVGVVAEIAIFIYSPKIFKKFDNFQLFFIAQIVSIIRWIATAYLIDNLMWIYFIQLMHGIGFGLFHILSLVYFRSFFPKPMRARAVGLNSLIGFGFGGISGGLLASLTWESLGGSMVFLYSAGISALSLIIWMANKQLFTTD